MFRPDASLPMRFARTVLVPFGPLIIAIALVSSGLAPTEATAGWFIKLAMVWFFCSLILVPALLFREESSPGSSTDDGDDGGGGDGGPPVPVPRHPGPGGIPLPDAEQSSERVRDHVRHKRPWPRRRTAREAEPASPPRVQD